MRFFEYENGLMMIEVRYNGMCEMILDVKEKALERASKISGIKVGDINGIYNLSANK